MNSKRPLRKEGILSQQLDDEWMLYNTVENAAHIINSMAETVWKMCDGNHSIDEIENHIKNSYLITDETNVKKDVEGIIQEFECLGVISSSSPDP